MGAIENDGDELFFQEDCEEDPRPTAGNEPSCKPTKKNRPMELSSKVAVPRVRSVVKAKRRECRDPRFLQGLCGHFNENLFEKSYEFVNELKSKEQEQLKADLAKVNTKLKKLRQTPSADQQLLESLGEEASKYKQILNVIKSKAEAKRQKDEKVELKRLWKKSEQKDIVEGKKRKQFHLKDSDLKKLVLLSRVENMKDSDLDKLLERKRKKNASKDKRYLPTR